jgi:hypothetical protein
MYNEVSLPIGRSFRGWREIYNEDIEMNEGYFYIGIIKGYKIWCYLNSQKQLIKHREPCTNNNFTFLNQLKTYHQQKPDLNGRIKEGFSFV